MTTPFICSSCRLQLARPRQASGLEKCFQHSAFGTSARSNQTERSLPQNSFTIRRIDGVSRRNEPKGAARPSGRDNDQSLPRGRYSGQPLRPQHLLQELERVEKPAVGRYKPTTGYKRQRDVAPSRAKDDEDLTHRNNPLLEAFMAQVEKAELSNAWQALHRIQESSLRVSLEQRPQVAKKLHQFMRKIVVHLFRNLGKDSDPSIPTPLEFMKTLKAMDILSPLMLSEALWRISNGFAIMLHADGEIAPANERLVLDQLISIWYLSFHSALHREDSARLDLPDEPLRDWSILPSPSSIASSERGAQTHLDDTLDLVLYTDAAGSAPGTGARGDYQSAFLVTHDVLQRSTLARTEPSWQPLLTFLDEVLKRCSKPSVPPTILEKLEAASDPSLGYYEAMVRRLNLNDIPAVRKDRNKILRDERSQRKRNALGRAIPQGPASGTLNEEILATKLGVPKEFTDNEFVNNDFDKAALLNAGFSVGEEWDMDPDIHRQVDDWVKRLGRSIENTNLRVTEICWSEVCDFSAEQAGSSSLPLYLYEHFMLAFLALRQPEMAIKAWRAVLEANLQPTVKTWTVMMRGCARANDPDTMEKFWASMRANDVQPDAHAWSIRLMGLMKAKRLQVAFPAMQEMGEEWVAAVRAKQMASLSQTTAKKQAHVNLPQIDLSEWSSDVDGVPRPNLVIVNSAVSTLAGKSDKDIPRVLSWARSFAIEFDLTTYNVLLNVSMRHGKTDEAMAILKHMQNSAIEPNSVTVTVLLAALFQSDYFANLSPEQQTSQLFALVQSIESSSPTARLNAKGYALAIDRMLKLYGNTEAARILLEQMSEKGIEPTSQIYTILMTSYFDADPPNFMAAEALWTRIQNSNSGYGAALDVVFYDRMVEAYARYHTHVGTGPMMKFLERMAREGKRPGWGALELVGRALAERNEWGLLHGLVDDLRNSKGLARMGARGLVGQNEFWQFILDTGILDAEGIISAQQLRKGVSGSSFHSL